MARSRTQRGVALITVMLIIAIATTAAVAIASRQQLDVRRASNTLYLGQAQTYAYAVEQWTKQFLAQDRKDNKIDHLGENWAVRLPPLPVEGGQLSGYLEDLQGRFNLNALAPGNKNAKLAAVRFKRLLTLLQIDPGLINNIQDWLDPDQEERFPGAEDLYYLGLTPPYRAANRPMTSPSELLLIKSVTREVYDKLRPFVTVLPEDMPININTAPAEMLATLSDGLVLSDLQALIANRKDKPWEKVNDLLKADVFAGKKDLKSEGLGVSSNYFLLRSEVRIGHIRQIYSTLFKRNEKGKVTTLMRAQGRQL